MNKSILITGSSGLVGSRFVELSKFQGQLLTPDEKELDITSKNSVTKFITTYSVDTVINFAAYTNVTEGEKERGNKEGLCWKLNVDGTNNLISSITSGTHFIQISTDLVFPGSKVNPGPYDESAQVQTDPDKVTWYGFTKMEGENLVREKLGKKATIVRLIYPVRAKYPQKLDYLRKPLKLFDEGKLYPLFTDQQISIAFIDEIVQALDIITERRLSGTFHISSCDLTTPYELISYFLEKVRGVKNAVKPSSLIEFLKTADNPVRYPIMGGLKVNRTQKVLGIKFSSWKEIVEKLRLQGVGS